MSRLLSLPIALAFLLAQIQGSLAATCDFVLPTSSICSGDDYGFIMIPGAQIPGEGYRPLAQKIQSMFPGNMWLGLTDFFLADFPNPIEISSAINACFELAAAAGCSKNIVFMGGHSLGGIVLETYIKDNPELAEAIVLFGSYLPSGWVGSDDNLFPVPVLTAVGTLDGGAISYVTREAKETAFIDETMPDLKGRFPVHIVAQSNHAQVASGEIPTVVIENDIDAEIDNDEALGRYASLATAFMVTRIPDRFEQEIVTKWATVLSENQALTDEFLEPFQITSGLEQAIDSNNQPFSQWVSDAQRLLLSLEESESPSANFLNSIVTFGDLGGVKPSVEAAGECGANIQTFAYNTYSFDPLDFGGVISAEYMKTKFKRGSVVREALCLQPKEEIQCKDLNIAAFNYALSLSSPEAVNRFNSKGRQLVFVDDEQTPWGPGWEFSSGLQYKEIDPKTFEVRSVSLVTDPDFFIPTVGGMHYCDILSPYRALEWIYIKGVVHGKS